MNIYDVLRTLIQNAAKPSQLDNMMKVIDDMQQLNAFGTIGQQHSGPTHDCVSEPFNIKNPGRQLHCLICGKAL